MEVALLGDCPLLAPAVRGAAHELVGAEEAVPRGPETHPTVKEPGNSCAFLFLLQLPSLSCIHQSGPIDKFFAKMAKEMPKSV